MKISYGCLIFELKLVVCVLINEIRANVLLLSHLFLA